VSKNYIWGGKNYICGRKNIAFGKNGKIQVCHKIFNIQKKFLLWKEPTLEFL
jgi:hypothetical protein